MFNLYHYFNGLLQKMNLSEKFKRLHGIIIETHRHMNLDRSKNMKLCLQ